MCGPDQNDPYVRVRSLERKHKKAGRSIADCRKEPICGTFSLERNPNWVQIQTLAEIPDVHNSAALRGRRLPLKRLGAHLGDRPLGRQVLLQEGTEVDSKPTRLHSFPAVGPASHRRAVICASDRSAQMG